MTEIIVHRRNTSSALSLTPTCFGVEIDVRSKNERLIVQHDPFSNGDDLVDWLSGYKHGTLILNVKEEGLEERLIHYMKVHGIEKYFFLDQSFPFLLKYAAASKGRCAVRVSEYESVLTAFSVAGKVKWVWVDCFTKFPISASDCSALKSAGFNLCLVSPELQGQDATKGITNMRALLDNMRFIPDAVCTKWPNLWGDGVETSSGD